MSWPGRNLFVLIILGGSVATAAAKPAPAKPAPTKPAPPAKPVALPGACVPVPTPDPTYKGGLDDLDLDGDGTADALVETLCTEMGCDAVLYVRRGTCGHKVGAMFVPNQHRLLAHRSHGLHDLQVEDGEHDDTAEEPASDTITYGFDGARYREVARKHNPGKP